MAKVDVLNAGGKKTGSVDVLAYRQLLAEHGPTDWRAYDTLRTRGPRRVLPMTVPMLMPNGAAGAVSLALGAAAGAHAPVSACASGAEALAWALRLAEPPRPPAARAGTVRGAWPPPNAPA